MQDRVADHADRTNVWFVRAGHGGSQEDYALDQGFAVIEWDEIPDLRTVSGYEDLRLLYAATYPEENPQQVGKHIYELWAFSREIEQGDYILLPLQTAPGRVAVGRVAGPYEWIDQTPHHRIPVEWLVQDLPRSIFHEDIDRKLRVRMTVHDIEVPDAAKRVETAVSMQTDPGPPAGLSIWSWSRPEDIPDLLGRKKVDWSMFEYGSTIPVELHAAFEAANGGEHLNRGERRDLDLVIENQAYHAVLVNVDRKDTQADTLQIRYDGNAELKQLLRERFSQSYVYILEEREKQKIDGSRSYVVVPGKDAEYMDFLQTGVPYRYAVRLINRLAPEELPAQPAKAPTIEDLARRVNAEVSELRELEEVLWVKRQVIFEGPPGAGKTFMAEAFARYFTGNPLDGAHDDHVVLVQFHQSYGYEDFIQGIRPETGIEGQLRYELRDGIFKALCRRAHERPEDTFIILIDEINRGNISRIFGELLLLLEYRDKEINLPYARPEDPTFSIPPNVYTIGTMNTADRSLAQIDYALRRRFYFWELTPVVEGRAPYLSRWLETQHDLANDERREVLRLFLALNGGVAEQLGPDFLIGHSYFMSPDVGTPEGRERIWRRGIIPLLREYFHNRQDREHLLSNFSILALMERNDGTAENESIT